MGCCSINARVLWPTLAVMGLSLAAGLIDQSIRGRITTSLAPEPVAPAPAQSPNASTPSATSEAKPALDPRFVDLAGAKAMIDAGGLHIVDARTQEDFDKGHIPGAMLMPPSAFFGGKIPEPIATNSMIRAFPVLIYCNGGDCDASEQVAIRLREFGFSTKIFHDGFPAWKAAGYSVEASK
jgi:rhodanese-related sulfurtransferase